ncbi:hypothetical protein [Paraburkholderia sp. A1RI-2L]|uniref:hypothetical protein n=1 Tax=Paraburkholderia sp. A1RI-2L TaxID=3028367 RepID=UPI003B9E8D20
MSWMLDHPRVNFAISQRGAMLGFDHLGIQVENEAQLAEIHAHLQDAAPTVGAQSGTVCCFAKAGLEIKDQLRLSCTRHKFRIYWKYGR